MPDHYADPTEPPPDLDADEERDYAHLQEFTTSSGVAPATILCREIQLARGWDTKPWSRMMPIFQCIPATFGVAPLVDQLRLQLRQKYGKNLGKALKAAKVLEEVDKATWLDVVEGQPVRLVHHGREQSQRVMLRSKYLRTNEEDGKLYHFEVSLSEYCKGPRLTAFATGLEYHESLLIDASMLDIWHVPQDCSKAAYVSNDTGAVSGHSAILTDALWHYANVMIATMEMAMHASLMISHVAAQMRVGSKADFKEQRVVPPEQRIMAMCHKQWADKNRLPQDMKPAFFGAYVPQHLQKMIHELLDMVMIYEKFEREHTKTGIETVTATVANVFRDRSLE